MKINTLPTGRLHLVMIDPTTQTRVLDRWVPNIVTSAGRRLLAQLLTGMASGIVHVRFAVGGPTPNSDPPYDPDPYPAPAPENEQLANELQQVDTEIENVVMRDDLGTPRAMVAISASLPADLEDDPMPLREAGLIITTTIGDEQSSFLYNRVVFDTITKQPELQLTMTWEVIF